jgi:hypothetical protein
MGNWFFSKSRRGIYTNPSIWRGPETALSEQLLKFGIDAKAFGVEGSLRRSTIGAIKVIVVLTTADDSQSG